MQPLAGRLEEYREQHLTCTDEDAMPGPYIVVRIEDKAAGIGNELPGVITGAPACSSAYDLQTLSHVLTLVVNPLPSLSLRAARNRSS